MIFAQAKEKHEETFLKKYTMTHFLTQQSILLLSFQ